MNDENTLRIYATCTIDERPRNTLAAIKHQTTVIVQKAVMDPESFRLQVELHMIESIMNTVATCATADSQCQITTDKKCKEQFIDNKKNVAFRHVAYEKYCHLRHKYDVV